MFDKLQGVEKRYIELEQLLSDSKVLQDRKAFQDYSREHAELSKVVEVYREHKSTVQELEDCQELLKDDDPEMKELGEMIEQRLGIEFQYIPY